MDMRETGRQRGLKAGQTQGASLAEKIEQEFAYARMLFPSLEGTDLAAMLCDYDRERLACEPNYTEFPEMRGLIDRHLGEREGFAEASGLDEVATAFNYSWQWLLWRRINSRHVPHWELVVPRNECTYVFFPEGAEGVTVCHNADDECSGAIQDVIGPWQPDVVQPNGEVPWMQGAVANGVLMDEDVECCFPCDPDELCPEEALDDIEVRMEFMTRYREFWPAGNRIWVDRHLKAVAVEKTNRRVAYHMPEVAGAVCVTACTYWDPDLRAFKLECMQKVFAAKGETEATSKDWEFDQGCQTRYKRLWKLTKAEAAKPGGATIWGALAIVADEAVPYPDRICLAGQKPEGVMSANWSLIQYACVLTGPRRRSLYRSIQDTSNPVSVTNFTPKLLLGEGIQMQPQWQADIDAGRCELAPAEKE